jgi:UrcA family protein
MDSLTAKNPTGLALLCATCLTTVAAVAEDVAAPAVTVNYTRADLRGPRLLKLYDKIRTAAREVCAPRDSAELTRHRLFQQCVDEAVARAVAQIDAEQLTTIHLAHGGTLTPRM